VNLLGHNIDTVKTNTETLTDASKDIGLKINAKETKYCIYVAISSPECSAKSGHKNSKQIV
jgi:hypothetical protein